MGIVKYDEHGIETIADRKSGTCMENRFVEAQIFKNERSVKSLKFSAYHDGNFFSSIDQFLRSLDSSQSVDGEFANDSVSVSVPYVRDEVIKDSAHKVLDKIAYKDGSVDLNNICSKLYIDLHFTDQAGQDGDGNFILGSVNFDRKSILIYSHDDKNRERFTIAHEIGHFCLKHDQYLRSEYIVEGDLFMREEKKNIFNYHRLEIQANKFASDLLLPEDMFLIKTTQYRMMFSIKDRGHGYIFVDDQPCNYGPYNRLLGELSSYFGVSKQVIEIKYKERRMLTDHRKKPESLSILSNMF
jgi:Zn-dependent peptidase ImmA (M78 family)